MSEEPNLEAAKEQAIRTRDRATCQACGTSAGEGIPLDAHQIVPGCDALSNYVLLCRSCHRDVPHPSDTTTSQEAGQA